MHVFLQSSRKRLEMIWIKGAHYPLQGDTVEAKLYRVLYNSPSSLFIIVIKWIINISFISDKNFIGDNSCLGELYAQLHVRRLCLHTRRWNWSCVFCVINVRGIKWRIYKKKSVCDEKLYWTWYISEADGWCDTSHLRLLNSYLISGLL